jgi:hypothetical protein
MRGFCTRCKEDRGDGEEWGIHFWENFPVCDKCGAYVVLDDDCFNPLEGEENGE